MGFENGRVVAVVLTALKTGTQNTQVTRFVYDLDDSLIDIDNDPQLLADAFSTSVMGPYKALFSNAWGCGSPVVEEVIDPLNKERPRASWLGTGGGVGTLVTATDLLPQAVCGLAALKTGFRGRRFNGRIFIPGVYSEGDQAAGVFGGGTVARMQAFLDAIPRTPDITSGPSAATAKWSVFSRTQRGSNLDPYLMPVSQAIATARVRWLRSRDA